VDVFNNGGLSEIEFFECPVNEDATLIEHGPHGSIEYCDAVAIEEVSKARLTRHQPIFGLSLGHRVVTALDGAFARQQWGSG
jgi:carbamoylphosphate synthase small subunit